MHKRRDSLGRFLPNRNQCEEYQAEDQNIEQEINPFAQIFADLDHNGLDSLIPPLKLPLEENPFSALVVYQGNMTCLGGGNNPPPPPEVTFKFPIPSQIANAYFKNKFPTTLPHFYGLIIEDPNTFLFEFDVLH